MDSIGDQLQKFYTPDLCQYYEKEFINFDQTSYIVHAFTSPVPREKNVKKYSQNIDIQKNDKFPLLFYVPENYDNAGIDHLVIMLNGFNEKKTLVKQYVDPNWGISHLLNDKSKKISSVLLPLTYHYWRKPIESSDHSTSFLVYENPIRFYMGYRQLMYDLDAIVKMVHNPPQQLKQFFQNIPKIHLYGFSVGGLGVFSFILKEQLDGKARIASATLLNSAGSLDAFAFSLTGLSERQVGELKQYYYSRTFEDFVTEELKQDIKQDDERIYRIFEHRVLGLKAINKWKQLIKHAYKQAMLGLKNKVLFVNGDDDQEVIKDKIFHSIPFTVKKQNKKKIVGLGHLPSWSRDWKNKGIAKEAVNIMKEHIQNTGR